MKNRAWLVLCAIVIAFLAHIFIQSSFFSLISINLTLPFLLTWLLKKPLRYLSIWALIAELFSTTPFGIMVLITFVPFILHSIFKKVPIDLSFSFLILTFITFLLQTFILFVPDTIALTSLSHIPWTLWVTSLGLTTLCGYSVCLVIEQLYPSHD